MEAAKLLCLTLILTPTAISAEGEKDPIPDIATENVSIASYETTEKTTQPPDGIENVPEELEPNPPSAVEGKEEEPYAIEEQPVVVSFPDNHKNFTPSQYVEDYPPYYNHLSSYQQQYKNYNEQKQIYNRKPIKFEENSLKNYYLPQWSNPVVAGEEKKNEGFRVNRNPFPYAFDGERNQEHDSGWYKTTAHLTVQEPQPIEHSFRGHQELSLPHYVLPHGHPQEEKLHKEELLHFGHHHLKKEEKGNPWKKVFHVLTALVPLGLLLATLTPNVISINSTATTKTSRKRSEDATPFQLKEEDVVKLLKNYGVESLSEMQCEDRIICELAREGTKDTAGPVEKGFWLLANQTPWDVADRTGMKELFQAIKTGNCEVFKCHSKKKSRSFGKKLMRTHKIPE